MQASKFISAFKSRDLITKLTRLTSDTNAAKLKSNVVVTGRVKSDNEKSYYIVEAINDAINEGKRISFTYTDYNAQKERVLRNDGKPYILSPYALIWDGDFYYVLGLNHGRNQLNTFRVDPRKTAGPLAAISSISLCSARNTWPSLLSRSDSPERDWLIVNSV